MGGEGRHQAGEGLTVLAALQRYAAGLILALAVLAAGYGYAQHLRAERAIARTERAEADAQAARRAATVLSEHMQRMQIEGARLNSIRDQIKEAPDDADLPAADWLRAAVDRLRAGATAADP